MQSPVIDLLQTLISCPSITPNDANCIDIITDYLQPIGFNCQPLQFEEVSNLWASYGTGKPLFVFAGHTDIVPPGPMDDWQSPPFTAQIRDGVLYGRGAADMKGALAAMIVAAKNFLASSPHFAGTIAFLLTSDEEGKAINGTQKVLQWLTQQDKHIDYCLIGEPSSENQLGDQIRVGRRGSLHGKLVIHGKQGHVAHPHLAKNPIHMSASALAELAAKTWDQGNQDFPPTTFQITHIHSGTGARNVIPGHLEVQFNFRYGTASDIDQIKNAVDKILTTTHLPYQLDWEIGGEPFLTKRGKFLTLVDEAIFEITRHRAKLSTGGGTSDGRFIAPMGTEVIELGVLHNTAHQVNECARVSDIENLTQIYQRLLEKLFIPVSNEQRR